MTPDVVKRKKAEADALLKQAEQQISGTPEIPAPAPKTVPVQAAQPVTPAPEGTPAPAAQPEVPATAAQAPVGGDVNLDAISDPMQLKQMLIADEAKMNALQHKYDVLQGKYNAEIGGVNQRLAEKDQMINFQQNQITQMNMQMQQGLSAQGGSNNAGSNAGGDNIDLSQYYSAEIIDSYDEDYLKAQVKNQQKQQAEIRSEIEPLKQQLASTQNDLFVSALRQAIPNYDALNNDPAFIAWLSEPVYPGATMVRQQMLDEEVQKRNSAGIAAIFSQFVPATAAPQANNAIAQQVVPASAGQIAKPSLNTSAVTYTGAEYQKLRTMIATRQITGQEADNLKAELELAVTQGRVLA